MTADPRWACHTKARYATEAQANRIAADCFRARGVWLRVYACEVGCGGFHLTHKDARPPANANWRPPATSERAAKVDRVRRRNRKNRRWSR